jgi:hypothetical protein
MPPKSVNTKKEAGLAKKADVAAKKQAEVDKERERLETQAWNKGADVRTMERADTAAAKADELARKKREKEALLAAEEMELSGASRIKKSVGEGMANKVAKTKKPTNDLSMLESALVSEAEKKARAKKKAEQDRIEQEKLALREKEQKRSEVKPQDELLSNTDIMLGGSLGESDLVDDNTAEVGRRANLSLGEYHGSGLDAAVSAMSLVSKGADAVEDIHPEKRMRALHMAFEEKMLPLMKEEFPGLRLSQYKEKIFTLWRKSPENPMNQQAK